MSAQKEAIRHEAIRHRDRIDPYSEDLDAVCDHFFSSINPQKDQIVSLYWPKGREFSPAGIMERLLHEGFTCALPVLGKREEGRALKFARWEEGMELEEGPFKVMQPIVNDKTDWLEPDILIVPLLAFDRRGNRLGYGGGHYDATLHELRMKKSIVAVGVGYAQQAVLFNLPAEEHDERLDWVVTPMEARRFQ